ncbi:MAG TPA: type II secretion system protein [Phycisphaerales bacterium]|nr:type II secretion system protein [Phycisphaerales bacterium]HIN83845.1 type II secretion system protein [Phycisphaerales bacterium]
MYTRGFTLLELIVVMVVMAILAGLSAIAYRGIAADMQMSAAVNTVTAALDNARAIAIKHNRYVITVFRPKLDDDGTTQYIELVIAEWNGDSASANRGDGDIWTYDRFVPVPKVLVRTISGGVNVAGPGYGTGDDTVWWACSYLPATNEPFGSLIGVLYSPEGRVVVRNAESGSDRIWVDYNRDWIQTINATTQIVWDDANVVTSPWLSPATPNIGSYFDIEIQASEPFVSMTPILAVFNEEACRKAYDPTAWSDSNSRERDYTTFIDANADRIQFNRYSGAVLK